jgi:hypothetical protein
MTVIAGIVGPNGEIYMAGDSAGTDGSGRQSVNTVSKVFIPRLSPAFVVGICGDYRLGQVLKYALVIGAPGPREDLEGFMSTEFVDAARLTFDEAGILTKSKSSVDQFGGTFLVGYQGRLFRIEDNFQIITDDRGYMACGGGEDLALGALFASQNVEPSQPAEVWAWNRLTVALEAAASFNATVRPPFQYLLHEFDPDWYQKRKRRRGKAK